MSVERAVGEELRRTADDERGSPCEPGDEGSPRRGLRLRTATTSERGNRPVQSRSNGKEHVLFADHRHQRGRQSKNDHLRHAPGRADVEPDCHEQRHRERGTGVRHRRRHVHVEHERCPDPDSHASEQSRAVRARDTRSVERGRLPQYSSRAADREQYGRETVERRPVGYRRHIRIRVPVSDDAVRSRSQPGYQVADRVERRPQQRAADGAEVRPSSCLGLALEKRLVEAFSPGDVALVEVLILVLERHVAVEPQRSEVGEILDLVRRVDARRDRRKRHDEHHCEHAQFAPRQRQ